MRSELSSAFKIQLSRSFVVADWWTYYMIEAYAPAPESCALYIAALK